ncbi:MAG: hypothetical protein QM597_05670 [Aeromicrobium sp.]|uniref:hypothetical protein n=1 Tax=Aeromicrobium sp. TaxID=1871063 RepID=UPI0039E47CA0
MSRRRLHDLIVTQWCVLLALVVALPWRGPGYVLSYDMLWLPRWDLSRDDLWGMGTAVPRAVPSDGVIAVLSQVIDPVLLQRGVLIAALALGGIGAARLIDDAALGVRLVAGTYALWNPFVAERLLLGQWPVLVALACLPWIVVAVRDEDEPRIALLTLALAGTALSAATGIMGLLVALVAGWRSGVLRTVLLAALVNAPWVVATVSRLEPVVSDPRGVDAFAVQPEGPLGRFGALAALGGVWNAEVVPGSRLVWTATLLVAVMWALILAGLLAWWQRDRDGLLALGALAVLGYALAAWGWVAPGSLRRLIEWQGAVALFRDGTRYLALAVPFHALALGYGAGRVGTWIASAAGWARAGAVAAGLAVALPLAALPDLAYGVGGRLEPVTYPDGWQSAAAQVRASEVAGDLLVLPFHPYRAPAWNDGRTVIDPAGRYFSRESVVSDALTVSGVTLEAEDPRVREIDDILADPAATPADLAREGIGLVLLDTEAPGGQGQPAALSGARDLGRFGTWQMWAVDGARKVTVASEVRTAVTVAWCLAATAVGLALLAVLFGLVGRIRRVLSRQR